MSPRNVVPARCVMSYGCSAVSRILRLSPAEEATKGRQQVLLLMCFLCRNSITYIDCDVEETFHSCGLNAEEAGCP